MIGFHNIAKMRSTTTGTGTLTLTTAAPGYLTFALAGVQNGERVSYSIRDGRNAEVGTGVYTASGTTLTRETVYSSTNGGSKINCTGNQYVMITMAAEDIQPFASYYTDSGEAVADTTDDHAITLDVEWVDTFSLATLGSNQITPALPGWYCIWGSVSVYAGVAMNGYIKIDFGGYVTTKGYAIGMGIQSDLIFCGPLLLEDPSTIGPVLISNHVGASVTVSISELTIFKIGNTL
jgi:hypothetical protein